MNISLMLFIQEFIRQKKITNEENIINLDEYVNIETDRVAIYD